jgi:DNA mismatch repair ATPase MutS
MACEISKGEGGLEEVTFLYKLTPGSCPKSYGVNVARLAGYFQANILATAFTQNSLANLIGEQVPNTQTCILISRNTCISASKG